MSFDDVQRFLEGLLGDNLHAKRILGSASIRVIVVLLDGWNGDWADVA